MDQERFDELLAWLDADREKAGAEYELIRKRLVKIFTCRGSTAPDDLADKTIDRVALLLPEIRPTYVGAPRNYFCRVAHFIWLEEGRKNRLPLVKPPESGPEAEPESEADERDLCQKKCMSQLSEFDRDLIVAYYKEEKHAKIENRRKLAEQLGLTMNALRIRATRIRAGLMKCVEECLGEGRQTVKQN